MWNGICSSSHLVASEKIRISRAGVINIYTLYTRELDKCGKHVYICLFVFTNVMSSTARKQAPRLAKPAVRYWKGKAPKGSAEVDSDSDAEEEPSNLEEGDIPINDHDEEDEDGGFGTVPKRAVVKPKTMNLALKDVSVSKEGKVVVAGREESGRTTLEEEEDEGIGLATGIYLYC